MNAATSVNAKKSTLINYGGHNIRETTSASFSVVRQSAESETDAGNFSISYVSAFSVARQLAKSETGTLIFGSVKFGSVVVFFFLTLTLIATFVKRTELLWWNDSRGMRRKIGEWEKKWWRTQRNKFHLYTYIFKYVDRQWRLASFSSLPSSSTLCLLVLKKQQKQVRKRRRRL